MKLERRVEARDVTFGGLYGGTPDNWRRYVPGPVTYWRDGEEITEQDYQWLLETFRSESFGST